MIDWIDEMHHSVSLRRYTMLESNQPVTNATFEMCTDLGVQRLNSTDHEFPSYIRQQALFWIIFTSIYYPTTLTAFYLLRRRYAMIRNRSFLLLLFQSLGQMFNISEFSLLQGSFCLCIGLYI